ncbi:hypothetical protein NDU88_002580 [Pleurodeles waltl]|uniref:Uncharacterized protein n=1 Tax=Pleurodeles waltl TaxID=8319 RepID=A0AAV7Q991_PLEWA|nr:hypothetical protein NDU88_002580 [Pleurodeles waltl]
MVSRSEVSHSSASHTSDSDQAEAEPKHPTKRKRKRCHTMSESTPEKNLLFDQEDIIHPRSTEWVPCMEVAHCMQEWLRKSFDKDVRSTLRSECPHKVVDTLEMDPRVAMLLEKVTKDLKKGLDRAWRGCQDKSQDS